MAIAGGCNERWVPAAPLSGVCLSACLAATGRVPDGVEMVGLGFATVVDWIAGCAHL